MDITSIWDKGKKKLWIVLLLLIAGLAAGWMYASRVVPRPYAEVTMITIDTDKSSVLGWATTLEDVTVSRRMATELMGIIDSSKVTRLAARYLSEKGYMISDRTLGGMVTMAAVTTNSSIIKLKAESTDPTIVIDVANSMATAFSDTLQEYTGATYISILDYAESISYTSGGNKMMYGMLGAVGGIAVGVLLVYLMILFSGKITTVGDLTRVTGVTRVSVIPLHNIK